MTSSNSRLLLQWVLWLIAIHSICFGLALIIFPSGWIEFFGFQLQEKFFADQGGVFHLIISLAYIMAALAPENSKKLVILSCVTKFTAAVFLFSYYLFDRPIIMVLFSGAGDLMMGLAILISYRLYIRSI
ncbi:MAG: hypothetical protein NTY96_03195 [Bacteroidetes bacterium]|nr:hypothetical protein [Bacteroidota bacterium]